MVPAGYHIGPGNKDTIQGFFGHTKAVGGIFTVHHHEIRPVFPDKAGQPLFQNRKSRLTDHIAYHDNF
ncbi:hypothetical protein FACS1894109_16260 [Spirochaetia bacterium]|nr:hypothetical protein FACS1894109_16260 [Spirochaetia bacterium]